MTAGTRWIRCYKTSTGPRGLPGWRLEPIDIGVADLVEQLQRVDADGVPLVPTVGCCDGHGRALPTILLADGRVLVVHPTRESAGL